MKTPQHHIQADQTHSAAPSTSQPRQAQPASPTSTAIAHSPRMTAQRKALCAAFGPHAATAQFQHNEGHLLFDEVPEPMAAATRHAAAGEVAPDFNGVTRQRKSGREETQSMAIAHESGVQRAQAKEPAKTIRSSSEAHGTNTASTQISNVLQLVLDAKELEEWAALDEEEWTVLPEDEIKQLAQYKKQRDATKAALATKKKGLSMSSWIFDGKTYHINLTTATYHVTLEQSPKIHYFFKGTGEAISDEQPTKEERGRSSVNTVFSALPTDVQEFIKKEFNNLL